MEDLPLRGISFIRRTPRQADEAYRTFWSNQSSRNRQRLAPFLLTLLPMRVLA